MAEREARIARFSEDGQLKRELPIWERITCFLEAASRASANLYHRGVACMADVLVALSQDSEPSFFGRIYRNNAQKFDLQGLSRCVGCFL